MSRRMTVLFAGLESLLVVGIGIAVPLLPLTIVWMAHFGFDPEWAVFWRAAIDIWLIGHGVDVTFVLDPATATALGLTGAAEPIRVSIALLGFALLTALLGVRLGGRIDETGHRLIGSGVAVAAFVAVSTIATITVLHPAARPSLWQGAILPGLVFAIGLAIGVLRAAGSEGWIARRTRPLPESTRAPIVAALRSGIAAAAIVLLLSSIAVTLLLVVGFAEEIRLYEALHTELVGGIALTAGQLALLPNLVIWAASWFTGPGFALGAGSHVSALGTAVGPVPALPVFGALPTGDLSFGYAGLLVPVVAGFLAGVAVRRGLPPERLARPLLAMIAAGGGITGGLVLGLLAAASSGSAGPGRLAEVGPDALLVAGAAALEFAIAIALGLAVPSRGPRAGRSRPAR